ncbi:phytanoyl-CoA dioxygenase family protein [Paenibacillus albus]|uniref:Phytanoyl-CoA dioxygenase n=1 Tax=Paenibacillus albus TaxID=2495582 RepID=A0A3S9A3A0_9BACL|nr:phytanoyl-CoA dioxygenase family protein [Paenibacillus albus]AZN40191.1 phytanoyl-CoA dioxygenase [Paenibacillus albus]
MLNPVVAPGELTDTDRFIFESWGYIVIPDVLSPEEVQACLEASKRIHDAAGTDGFGQVGRGYETELALEKLMDHPAVMPKVRGIYGDRFIMQSGWNTKQPAFGPVGGWHQDGSGAYDFKKLSFHIPLLQLRASFLLTDQTKPRMGNMELIPGSHRAQVPMPDSIRKEKGDISIGHVICAKAGDVLLFHNAVWHRTYAHDGDYDRYTMHYIYSPPWVKPSDRLQNSQSFLDRTTPLRRALMGEFHRPDAPFGAGYEPPPFDAPGE